MADGGSEFENSPRRVKSLLPLAIFSHDRRGGSTRFQVSMTNLQAAFCETGFCCIHNVDNAAIISESKLDRDS